MKFRLLAILALLGLGQAKECQSSPLQLEPNKHEYLHSHSRESRWSINLPPDGPDLPDYVVPKAYTLSLRPILDPNDPTGEQWTAPGHVNIVLEVASPTNKIVLNRHPTLNIHESSVVVTGPNGESVSVLEQTYEAAIFFHTIVLKTELLVGLSYKLSIDFTAPVSATTQGLYRAEYKDENGTEYRLAATQFEYSNARQAFPGFDEPRWKTPFTISLGYKNQTYNTLGNSKKLITAQPDPNLENWVWDHFETTVPSSTYLVAMIVSNFDYLDAPQPIFDKERPVRIYGEPRYIAPGGSKESSGGKFAANASAHILEFLEKKYDHKYEMPKMDSVAIPNPFFGPGAMENWGLNTYKEDRLLFFDGEQGWSNKESITGILSHELAHQWFGNLVTCNSWYNLWLNEGFATYVASVAVEATHPEFEALKVRLTSEVQNALSSDVALDTEPIYSIKAPSVIIYDKGGSLIRMMEGFLGEQTLTKGLINYLKEKAYAAAAQDELFEHLTTQALLDKKLPQGKTIKEIMDTWTLQAGFPLIRASAFNSSHILISQERFQPAGAKSSHASVTLAADETYEVPIATATHGGAAFSNHTPALWLSRTQNSAFLPHDSSKWILINPDAMAYYRVLYDEELTEKIQEQLRINASSISALSRSQLIDDYFNFYSQGHISVEKALDMTTFLTAGGGVETEFVVWYTVFKHLTKALTLFQAHNKGPNHSLRNYLLESIENALFQIGWRQVEREEGQLVLYKATLLDWACALESKWCTSLALNLVSYWISNPTDNQILVDTQQVLYCAAVADETDGERVFNFLLEQFGNAPVGTFKTHRSKLLNALACSKNEDVLKRLLSLTIDQASPIGNNPVYGLQVLQRVAGNSIGRRILFDFLHYNFDSVASSLGGVSAITTTIQTLSSYWTTEIDLVALQVFVDNHAIPKGSVDSAFETIASNIEWIATEYKRMDQWLASH